MFIKDLNHVIPSALAGWVSLNLPDSIKEDHMLIIKLLNVHKEGLIPDIGLRDSVVSPQVQLSSVGMVSVLDMGGQPILGPLNNLEGNHV